MELKAKLLFRIIPSLNVAISFNKTFCLEDVLLQFYIYSDYFNLQDFNFVDFNFLLPHSFFFVAQKSLR